MKFQVLPVMWSLVFGHGGIVQTPLLNSLGLDRGNGNLLHGGAFKVLQCILVSVVMHGHIRLGEGKCLRADRLQAGGGAGPCRGAAVVYTVVGLNAGVDGRRGTRRARFSYTCRLWTTPTVSRLTGPASLVHQPLLWLGGQYVGRVGLMMRGFITIDFQAALSHCVQASLLFAAEKAQCHPLQTAQHTAAETCAVTRVHKWVDAWLEENEHKATQFKLVMCKAAFWWQNILCQWNSHWQAAKQHREHYHYTGENGLRVFGCGQVDCSHQLTAGGSLGSPRNQRLARFVGIGVCLNILQFVVCLVTVQRWALNTTLHVLKACSNERWWGRRARSIYCNDRAFPHLCIFSQCLSNH